MSPEELLFETSCRLTWSEAHRGVFTSSILHIDPVIAIVSQDSEILGFPIVILSKGYLSTPIPYLNRELQIQLFIFNHFFS